MYEVTIERRFVASHAVTVGGCAESPHEHDWVVTVVVRGEELDGEGMLCDFHKLEGVVEEVLHPLRGVVLNTVAPFEKVNPTAEQVARHIADSLVGRFQEASNGAALAGVTVSEAPGCTATYRIKA